MLLAKRYILIWINITFLFISSNLAIATTLRVGPSGYPYTSIQAAIDDAVQYLDEVLVYDGIYHENINFKGKSITVRSVHGAFFTIIDGSFNGSVVTFCNNENSSTKLKGFTIRNGLASLGGGIHCSDASPQIIQCIIRNNTASEGGGGIYFYDYSYPTLSDCIVTGNTASVHGGGIYSDFHPSPTITNCLISRNSVHAYGGGIYLSFSPATIINCVISNNTASKWGGGVECVYSLSKITNCTISNNTASGEGGGIYCYGGSTPKIINSILWGNRAGDSLNAIYIREDPGPAQCIMSVAYSNIQLDSGVYPGADNINTDPFFVDSENDNYYLQGGSPCIDIVTSEKSPSTDLDGTPRPQGLGGDIGAYEYVESISCIPKASFTATQTIGTNSLTVFFNASSSGGSQYSGADFLWDFGDGSTGNGITTSHSYVHWGSHDVSLTITTGCGSHTLTLFDLIKIKSSPVTKEVGAGYAYQSIQEAIDDAIYGDTILVHDGVYFENIDFKDKGITVRSENGPASTIIDGNGNGSVVRFGHAEITDSVLEGFTIKNGWASHGGGIYCASSPRIINCNIRGNMAYKGGGGIYCYYASPIITSCMISDNYAFEGGGGISCQDSTSPRIINCTISGNRADYGGGIRCSYSSAAITNCTITGNAAHKSGGGIYCIGRSSPVVVNSILWGNSAIKRYNEIYFDYPSSSITVNYSDVQWEYGVYKGTGNINSDPRFVNSAQGNLYLQAGSPCIDSGTFGDAPSEDGAEVPRPQGPGIDMGAYEHVDEISCLPRASFTATQTEGTDSLTVNFDASTSSGREYNGAGFFWDFGDDATGSGLMASHTYSHCGSFDIRLLTVCSGIIKLMQAPMQSIFWRVFRLCLITLICNW